MDLPQQGFRTASRIDHILIDPHLRPALLSAGILKIKVSHIRTRRTTDWWWRILTERNYLAHRHLDGQGNPNRQPQPMTGWIHLPGGTEEKERAKELTELSKQKFKSYAAALWEAAQNASPSDPEWATDLVQIRQGPERPDFRSPSTTVYGAAENGQTQTDKTVPYQTNPQTTS